MLKSSTARSLLEHVKSQKEAFCSGKLVRVKRVLFFSHVLQWFPRLESMENRIPLFNFAK